MQTKPTLSVLASLLLTLQLILLARRTHCADINASMRPEACVHNFVTNIDQSIFAHVGREKPTNKTKHIWGDFFNGTKGN